MEEYTFAIDYVRQIIAQTMQQNCIDSGEHLIGNENDVSLVSFYEHLRTNEEVNRFVETIRDLTEQENRLHLILNGVIASPTNANIVNINQKTIIPFEFSVAYRCTLEDRDIALESLNEMVSALKGRKRDIAVFDNGKVFMVGTIANNSVNAPALRNGDFIGAYFDNNLNSSINVRRGALASMGLVVPTASEGDYYYYESNDSHKLYVVVCKKVVDDNNVESLVWTKVEDNYQDYPHIIFPPEHNSFVRKQVSLSFETNNVSEPRTIDAQDYVDISFGGSATVADYGVRLGNQLTKVGVKRKTLKLPSGDINFSGDNYSWLEPLELPSGGNLNTIPNQLMSNKFLVNSHTDALTPTIQYTFIVDNEPLIKGWFNMGRYGESANIESYASVGITPNMIYQVVDLWSSWGNIEWKGYLAKLVGDIDIENTEGDVLTLTISMQVQGANN